MATILVIDDIQEIRENIKEYLEIKGHNVLTAANGEEGIARAATKQIDLVLCDVKMPKKDGFTVLQTFKENPILATVPFIFLSASAQKEDVMRGTASTADGYLTKPFTFNQLDILLQRHLNPL